MNNNRFKEQSRNIIKCYKDDVEAFNYVKSSALTREMDSEFSKKSVIVFQFLNFITDNVSKTYQDKVSRTLNEKYQNNEVLNKIFGQVTDAFDNISNTLDKYTFLTGTTAAKPFYNDNNDKFKFIVYTSDMLDYTPNYKDKTEADEVEISYTFDNVQQKEIYSNSSISIYADDISIDNGQNPYGEIPLVFFKNNEDSLEFFDNPRTNLLNIQNILSKKLINSDATFKMQGNAILVAKGVSDVNQLNVGPYSANVFSNPEATIEYVNPGVDLVEMVNFINEEFSLYSKISGIPDALFSVNNGKSGVSIIASQRVIDDYVKARQKLFINKEKELIEMGMRVLAFHKNIKIPDDFEVQISYKKKIDLSSSEEITSLQFYLDNFIYNQIEILMQLEDLNYEEAEERIKRNVELRETYKINNEDFFN